MMMRYPEDMRHTRVVESDSRLAGKAAPRASLLLALVGLLLTPFAEAQTFKDTYPKLAHIPIRYSKDYGDPDYRERLAKFDIVVLGMWRGFITTDLVSGETLNVRDVVVDIDRRAGAMGNGDIILGKYTALNEVASDPNNGSKRDKREKLASEVGPGYPVNNDWFARDRNGNNLSSWPGTWLTNMTDFVQPDANGDTYPEWAVRRDYDVFFREIPELDMWYFDNWFYRPRVDADWDGDGVNDDRDDPAVRRYFREGHARGLARAKELAPDLIMIGNVDGNAPSNLGMLTEPEYRGKMTALFEAAMGRDHSAETWGGWKVMMKQYQTTIANAQHNVAIFHIKGDSNGLATMRYGLASCLMDNGYYFYSAAERGYRQVTWFDEFELDLGRAIDPPQFEPWQKGVYMRRFENGMAIVNPKGNGTRTVSIPEGYKRFQGTQDPVVNNGEVADSVTLPERDGIILLRTDVEDSRKRPKPPVLAAN